jgi:hypothetical protein
MNRLTSAAICRAWKQLQVQPSGRQIAAFNIGVKRLNFFKELYRDKTVCIVHLLHCF